jgi:hypothetical protein
VPLVLDDRETTFRIEIANEKVSICVDVWLFGVVRRFVVDTVGFGFEEDEHHPT